MTTSALHFAAKYAHSKVVDPLLDKGADLNLTEKISGHTPLHLAPESGNTDTVRLLQYPNIQPNLGYGRGHTPLSTACFFECLEVVRLLLQYPNIEPNLADKDGGTPLFAACFFDHQEVVRLLLQHPNIQPDLADKNG
ncbi:ankyrin repeat protein [Mycena floridula]|nr:ankyrin repeat protein [Mycena floridula]KAJ7572230.1 ankyrin repeat protein [Mycena floridula]